MPSTIMTIIFNVDNMLFDAGNRFTSSCNGECAQAFMVTKLGFSSRNKAKLVQDEYFEKYHSTAKALTVAEEEGRLPKIEGAPTLHFHTKGLAEWWATKLDFQLLGGPNQKLQSDMEECPLQLVAFSNGPLKYVIHVLNELGLWDLFGDDRLFAVDDVLPHCKPEKEAFQKIFDKLGIKAK